MSSPITDKVEILKFIFFGGKTKRFHTSDTLTTQTIAEHSFGVAWICYLISENPSVNLILAALAHDLPEQHYGDMNGWAKQKTPALGEMINNLEEDLARRYSLFFFDKLSEDEQRILQIADRIDGMMFCIRERVFGSKAVQEIYENFLYLAMKNMKREDEVAHYIVSELNNIWENTNGKRPSERKTSWGKPLQV